MSEQLSQAIPDRGEVQRALRRYWQPVARLEDLKHGPQRAVLLGEALVVFLTEDGRPAVLADRCAHRGGSLSMGTVRGEAVRCPYHGWEWAGRDGACVRVPSLADQAQIPPRARVPAFPAREQWGLVWSVLEEPLGDPPNPSWFDPDGWHWAHGGSFELPVSFGVMIENFRDVAHFSFVHKETLGDTPELVEPLQVERSGLEVRMSRQMRAGAGAEEVWGSLKELHYHVIAPNFTSALMVHASGERCLLHAARAISSTASAHYWIGGVSSDYSEHTLAEAIEFEARVYAEDLPIVAAVEPPELDLNPDSDVNTLADGFTLAYRAAFSEAVRGALQGEASGSSSKVS